MDMHIGIRCILAACIAFASAGTVSAAKQAGLPLRGQVVLVDAGHGGRDAGGQVPGLDEKDLVHAIARRTAASLRRAGARVVESRTSDANLVARKPKPGNLQRMNLQARVELAERSRANVFLSIHANKYSDPTARGAQVFLGEQPDPVRQLLGACLQSEIAPVAESRRSLDMTRDLYLMRHLKIPAALIEVGFMTNPAERQQLVDSAYQERLAEAITRGVACFVSGQAGARSIPGPPRAARTHGGASSA